MKNTGKNTGKKTGIGRRGLVVSVLAAAVAGGVSAWWITRDAPTQQVPLDGAMAAFELHEQPRPMPEISFQDAAGNTVSLDDFAGEVVLINLWATWCPPCVHELPTLDALQAGLGDAGLTVAAVSIDLGGIPAIGPFYQQHGIGALAPYADPNATLLGDLQVVGLPTTVLFDRQGREVGRLAGDADWFSPEAQALVQRYLGTDSVAPAS